MGSKYVEMTLQLEEYPLSGVRQFDFSVYVNLPPGTTYILSATSNVTAQCNVRTTMSLSDSVPTELVSELGYPMSYEVVSTNLPFNATINGNLLVINSPATEAEGEYQITVQCNFADQAATISLDMLVNVTISNSNA